MEVQVGDFLVSASVDHHPVSSLFQTQLRNKLIDCLEYLSQQISIRLCQILQARERLLGHNKDMDRIDRPGVMEH